MPTVIKRSQNSVSKSLSVRSEKGSRDLLEEASADVTERLDPESEIQVSFSDFVIQDYLYNYPREREVPEGWYLSEISNIDVRVKNAKKILDVSYNLENGYGQRFYILQSYPLNSAPLKRFYTAMVNFGLDSGTCIDRVVGVTEKIFLEYPPGGSKIGSITKRVPYDPPEEDVADDE